MFGKGGSRSEDAKTVPGRRQNGASTAPARPSAQDLSTRYAFRRNRTLTGSSSAKIASSNELNAELRSPRAHVHHLTSLRRRLLAYFTGVAVVSFALYMLVSQLVASTVISMDGSPSVASPDTKVYADAFESYYAARPAERFRFLLDSSALLMHVRALHPEVRSVRIEPGSKPGEASVNIETRKPIARWSIDSADQYVDGEGVVFAKNYHAEPHLQIVDESGLGSVSNGLVASDRFLGFIGLVVSKSERLGLEVQSVTIPALTTRQVALSLVGQGTQYKLSVDRSPGKQIEDISRINRYLSVRNIKPSYVDVRIEGKAYYR